jgi:hypothetical protein
MAEAREAVAAAAERGALLWTLPWVGCLLWFWPPGAPPAPAEPAPCRALLDQLCQIRCLACA